MRKLSKTRKAQEGTDLTRKYKYVEGEGMFGVGRAKPTKSGGLKTKAVVYNTGFAPSNARVLKETTDAQGNITKSKERPISVKRASKSMVRKAGEYRKGGVIRAAAKRNKAAGKRGKKPTKAMLKQEAKIKKNATKKSKG